MKFYFGIIYYCCFGLAMLHRLISDFTWHVSTGLEKENLIFFLFLLLRGVTSEPTEFEYLGALGVVGSIYDFCSICLDVAFNT